MTDDRAELERLLGASLRPSWPVRLHRYEDPAELDYRVTYAAVELPEDDAARVSAEAGLASSDARTYARVLLPGGWRAEPGDPPTWWPREPGLLREQGARAVDPNGWLAVGYQDGTLFVIATEAGSG